MQLTKSLFEQIARKHQLYFQKNINRHPYNNKLIQGTLSHGSFEYYLRQDQYYLYNQSITFKYIAKKMLDDKDRTTVTEIKNYITSTEKDLIKLYLPQYSSSNVFFKTCINKPNEYTQAYIKHITNDLTTYIPPEFLLIKVLPCFRSYMDIYKNMMIDGNTKFKQPDFKYKNWIESYNTTLFIQYTKALINIFDKLTINCNTQTKNLLSDEYLQSLQHEKNLYTAAFYQGNKKLIEAYNNHPQYLKKYSQNAPASAGN